MSEITAELLPPTGQDQSMLEVLCGHSITDFMYIIWISLSFSGLTKNTCGKCNKIYKQMEINAYFNSYSLVVLCIS